jgi:hypothetical protein
MTMIQASNIGVPFDEITIARWQLPAEAIGALGTMASTGPFGVGAGASPYFAPQAIDLPGSDWTMVGYADLSLSGEIVALDGTTVADSWPAAGYYGAAASGDANAARLLHSGLSPLDSATVGAAALHASDFCAGPALCANGAKTIDAWGSANGPVAIDGSGNVLALQTGDANGDQVLRGFHAADVAPGSAGAASGVDLLVLAGFGSALAAIAPGGSTPGLALYQPQVFTAQVDYGDVVVQRYDDDGGSIAPSGASETALAMLTPTTEVTLMTDHLGRLWVGVASGAMGSTFYVLDRAR